MGFLGAVGGFWNLESKSAGPNPRIVFGHGSLEVRMPVCVCNICKFPKSSFVMNNKLVCLRCDELMFDIEIECEEIQSPVKIRQERKKIEAAIAETKKASKL